MHIPRIPLVVLVATGAVLLSIPVGAQTVRPADRPARGVARTVDGVSGAQTLFARSADDLFQRLPQELEDRDARRLARLLAPSAVSVGLEGPDRVREVSPEQAFFLIDDHFAGLRHDASRRLALDGYASSSGRLVCVPDESADPDRSHAVLHLMLLTPAGPHHTRIHVEARRFDRGWRITALRSLD